MQMRCLTTRLLPSLRPHVCSAKPPEVSPTLAASPAGTHSGCRAASRKPVRQHAADKPKQAPACSRFFKCQDDIIITLGLQP